MVIGEGRSWSLGFEVHGTSGDLKRRCTPTAGWLMQVPPPDGIPSRSEDSSPIRDGSGASRLDPVTGPTAEAIRCPASARAGAAGGARACRRGRSGEVGGDTR